MTDQPTFSCPACGASYRLKPELAGQRVKCRKCSEILTVPEVEVEAEAELEELEPIEELEELEEVEELEEAAPARRPATAGARSSRGRAGSRSSRAGTRTTSRTSARRGRSEPSESKSRLPFILGGVGLIAVIAIVLATMGNGNGDDNASKQGEQVAAGNSGGSETGEANPAGDATAKAAEKPVKPKPPEKTPRQRIEEALMAAANASNDTEKVAQLWRAAELRRKTRLDGVETAEAICKKIIAIEPDHAEARKALGHVKYDGVLKDRRGQWVTAENKAEFVAAEKAYEKAEAERKERERWRKDAFTRKCAKVRDHFLDDIKQVPGLKLKFYFDIPEVPRPYFVMAEDVKTPDPEQTAKLLGPGLNALRKAFFKAYGKGIVAAWDDEKYVVPVMVLKDDDSYKSYRDHGHSDDFPSTKVAAAFYVPQPFGTETKGVLYTWQTGNESEFYHRLFHEAVHQLMHNSCQSVIMGSTPWLEEGFAEYFGAHTGNIAHPETYRFGTFLKGRYSSVQESSKAMLNAFKVGKREGAFLSPKQMLSLTQEKFSYYKGLLEGGKPEEPGDKARAHLVVDTVYSQGWAWIFFCYNYEGGLYREAFELLLKDELRYQYSIDKVARYFGVETDEDWDELARQFAVFALRGMRHYWDGTGCADPTKKN